MGVVNVTPDSFSDGGRYLDPAAAIAHGLELVAQGADLLDVGGESTRPGAVPVAEADERARVLPVVSELAANAGVPVSIDTTKAAVAAAALEAGATVVNDVSAGLADPQMLPVVAAARAGYVAMHMRGEPRTMQTDPRYGDVVHDVGDFLLERLGAARAAGVESGALCADPGIGFGKTAHHNLALLARLSDLVERVGVPVLVGTSRKTFIGAVLADALPAGAPPVDRDDGTLATVVWAVDRGVGIVRVHAVRPRSRGYDSGPRCARSTQRRQHEGPGPVKGRWAQGLEPRAFCWVIKDRLAASERPGGFARNHRKVRRQEELIWLIGHGFTHVLTILDSPHNLHAYEEAGVPHAHVPLGRHDEWPDRLPHAVRHAQRVARRSRTSGC